METYFQRMAGDWLCAIKDARQSDKDLTRMLALFAKEIERDTRHKAAHMAAQLSTNIHNMKHEDHKK